MRRRDFVNCQLSQEFPIKAGVAHGFPPSFFLFLFVAEDLSKLIISGAKLDSNETYNVSQLADDTVVILSEMKGFAYLFNTILFLHEAAIAMKIKASRTGGLLIGTSRIVICTSPKVAWCKEGEWLISLGFPLGKL